MEALIQVRRGTAAQWIAANPVLGQGEPGLETDSGKGKFGDGTTHWNSLLYSWAYLTGPTGPAGGDLTGTYPNPTIRPALLADLALDVKDEGTAVVTDAKSINFVGAGVTAASGGSGVATVTIAGGTPGTVIPPGTIARFASTSGPHTIPSGWYECNGTVHADMVPYVGSNFGASGSVPELPAEPEYWDTFGTIGLVWDVVNSGWTVDNARAIRQNGVTQVQTQVHRSGATIPFAAVDHADQTIGTVSGNCYNGVMRAGGCCQNALRSFFVGTSGDVKLTAGITGVTSGTMQSDINNGDVFMMGWTILNDVAGAGLVYYIIKAP